MLIDKINEIRNRIPDTKESEDEKAYDEAAEEFYMLNSRQKRR